MTFWQRRDSNESNLDRFDRRLSRCKATSGGYSVVESQLCPSGRQYAREADLGDSGQQEPLRPYKLSLWGFRQTS